MRRLREGALIREHGNLPVMMGGVDSGGYDFVWKSEIRTVVAGGMAWVFGCGDDLDGEIPPEVLGAHD